jgi:hypothetical protein
VLEGKAERLLAVVGRYYFVASALETEGDECEDVLIVVGYEDERGSVSIRTDKVIAHRGKIVASPFLLETLCRFPGTVFSLVRGEFPVPGTRVCPPSRSIR